MKKNLLILIAIVAMITGNLKVTAQRYLNYVFPSATVTNGIVYAQNYQFFPFSPTLIPLTMDVYEPGGAVDPLPVRPLIVYIHTGSFLPAIVNNTPTGSIHDSS